MIFISCSACKLALRVNGDAREIEFLVGQSSEFWPDKYICHACGKPALGCLTPQVSEAAMASLQVVDVSAAEAFAAMNGLGLPEEQVCCREVVVPLLERCGISVRGRSIRGTQRFLLDELTFPDGTKLFLSGSAQGAVAYRVTKPHSYTAEAGGADE